MDEKQQESEAPTFIGQLLANTRIRIAIVMLLIVIVLIIVGPPDRTGVRRVAVEGLRLDSTRILATVRNESAVSVRGALVIVRSPGQRDVCSIKLYDMNPGEAREFSVQIGEEQALHAQNGLTATVVE